VRPLQHLKQATREAGAGKPSTLAAHKPAIADPASDSTLATVRASNSHWRCGRRTGGVPRSRPRKPDRALFPHDGES